ncbi:small nuclear ribonucleoprotein [Colletotrichum tamarilloi]|uniref:LSM complex subunit LSM4 n=1 Tax=Colletotrichum tamarilloi TaxID=1209934 RepID=A0ABQ9RMT1_9PEZI|nr:small nuclear ribonucleoprotein [Colletotrichum tamarilloi]KAK1507599.1 small nuclear ribonucleoprotein [Colletotrichum tamarilloi]
MQLPPSTCPISDWSADLAGWRNGSASDFYLVRDVWLSGGCGFEPHLPLGLLNAAQGHPMLVELKNGETLNGHLVMCDTWMNLTLKEVVQTSPEGDKFVKIPEVYVKGNNIKYLRVPDDIIDVVKENQQNQQGGFRGGRGGSRGDHGGRGGDRGRGRGQGRGGRGRGNRGGGGGGGGGGQ